MKGKKWIIVLTGAIVVVLLLRGFVFTSYIIPSSGMENALLQGDRIIVNKWSYGLRVPFMSFLSYHRWNSRPVETGDIVVFNNPGDTKQPIIDRRGTFIGRCIAAPGDTLVIDSLFSPAHSLQNAGPDRKQLYTYPKGKERMVDSLLVVLNITQNLLMGENTHDNVRSFSTYEMYLLEQACMDISWLQPLENTPEGNKLVIPAKGKAVDVRPWNTMLYRNTLLLHEGIKAEVKNDSLYINGKSIIKLIFSKDYYWMASNNSVNLVDSRLFGLVPHDHVIGKASFIWFSKEAYTGLTHGHRWERFFRSAK